MRARYVTAPDGFDLAYDACGTGPPRLPAECRTEIFDGLNHIQLPSEAGASCPVVQGFPAG